MDVRVAIRKRSVIFAKALASLIIAACMAATIIPPFLDRIYYSGPKSGHFDGARFFNPDGEREVTMPTGGSRQSFFLRWLTGRTGRAPWPDSVAVIPTKPALLPPLKEGEMRAIWIGHATTLVQVPGLNILTDPIWSKRSGPLGFGPARVAEPGIAFDDLPKINIILLSHNHYDHMDLDTLERLWRRDRPAIYTTPGNDSLLKDRGIESIVLDWGQGMATMAPCAGPAYHCPSYSVTATRNHHWSSRWFTDQRRALWSSFVVTLPGGNLFFAGDTGFGDGKWAEEARALGPIRLALIPIGAFRFGPGMMDNANHIGPIQAERIFAGLATPFAIPIHWGTFQLSYEAIDTPPKMLAEVIKCAGYADPASFQAVAIGRPILVPILRAADPRPAPAPACLTRPAIRDLR
jgi:L-ascorbate metabolism protein UlaG (beta-lactamase superfamily)